VEDMCYERRRAEACVDESAHHALDSVSAGVCFFLIVGITPGVVILSHWNTLVVTRFPDFFVPPQKKGAEEMRGTKKIGKS
jgi:hypothetical protein